MANQKNNLNDEYSLENILEEARKKRAIKEQTSATATKPILANVKSPEKTPAQEGKLSTGKSISSNTAGAEYFETPLKRKDENNNNIIPIAPAVRPKHRAIKSDRPLSITDTLGVPIIDATKQYNLNNIDESSTQLTPQPTLFLDDQIKAVPKKRPNAITAEELLGKKQESAEVTPKPSFISSIKSAAQKAESIIKNDQNVKVTDKTQVNEDFNDLLAPKKKTQSISMSKSSDDANKNTDKFEEQFASFNVNDLQIKIDNALREARAAKNEADNYKISEQYTAQADTAEDIEEYEAINKNIDFSISQKNTLPKPKTSHQPAPLREEPVYTRSKLEQIELGAFKSNMTVDNIDENSDMLSTVANREQKKVKVELIDDRDEYNNVVEDMGHVDVFSINMENSKGAIIDNQLEDFTLAQANTAEVVLPKPDKNDTAVNASVAPFPLEPSLQGSKQIAFEQAVDDFSNKQNKRFVVDNIDFSDGYEATQYHKSKINDDDNYFSHDNKDDTATVKRAISQITALNDYESLGDAGEIRRGLEKKRKHMYLAVIGSSTVTLFFMIMQCFYSFTSLKSPLLIKYMWTAADAKWNIVWALVMLLLVVVANYRIFLDMPLVFIGKANSNTVACFVASFCIAHQIYLLNNTDLYFAKIITSYALIACFILTANAFGNLINATNVRENFEIVANESLKHSCFSVDDKSSAIAIASGTVIGAPHIVACGETVNYKDFLHNAYKEDPSVSLCSRLLPVAIIMAVGFSITLYLINGSMPAAITFFIASVLILSPVYAALLAALPIGSENSLLRQNGSMIAGYFAVDQFGKMNAVAVDAQNLFPVGTVKIFSIQTFGTHQIDNVLLQAAGVAISSGGSLADVFEQVIEGHYTMLPKVDGLHYIDELGVVGEIDNVPVFVGNRDLLKHYKIDRPNAEIERQIRTEGKYPIYLAVGMELCAMFVVSYEVNDNVEEMIHNIISVGNTLLVRTVDPNIDVTLICTKFHVPGESVHIMRSEGAEIFANATRLSDRTGGILTKGTVLLGSSIASSCVTLLQNIKISTTVQVVCCFIGYLLFAAALMTRIFSQGFLPLRAIFIFELVTGIATLAISIFRKPKY